MLVIIKEMCGLAFVVVVVLFGCFFFFGNL